MHTPGSKSTAIVRTGLEDSPIGKLPPELRLRIIQQFIQSTERVAVVPKAFGRKTFDAPFLRPDEPQLVFTTTNPLAETCTQLHEEYTKALKSHVLSCKAPNLVLHVLDFDFSPIINEILSAFLAANRQYYYSRAHSVNIQLTITEAFARLPDEKGLGDWLQWRATEESVGRGVNVRYAVQLMGSTEGANEMEALRYFLILYDPYSTASGEVGDIMRAMKAFFEIVASYAGY